MNNITTNLQLESGNTIAQFEQIANQCFNTDDLQDGYALFCKHLFIKNDFTNDQCASQHPTHHTSHPTMKIVSDPNTKVGMIKIVGKELLLKEQNNHSHSKKQDNVLP